MSPDGEHDQVSTEEEDEAIELYNENFATSEIPENLYASETVPQEAESSANWPKVPSFFPQPDNPESLKLPQPLATFDRVFEPSSKSEEADWFVLDENGTRQLNLDIENHATSEERIDEVESGIETDYEDSTERKVFGDFEPIIGPIQ